MTAVLAAFCFALPLAAVFLSKGVVPLLVLASGAGGLLAWRARIPLRPPDRWLVLALGAFLAWCALASLWSFDPAGGLILAVRLAALFAAGLLLVSLMAAPDAAARARIGGWLAAGLLAAMALVAAELISGFALWEAVHGWSRSEPISADTLNRGATAVAILVWPAAALLWPRGRRTLALGLPVLAAALLSLLTSLAALTGLAAGALVAALALAHRRAGAVLLALGVLGAFVLGPLAGVELYRQEWHMAGWLPSTAQHRVEIWHAAAEWIAERPLFGWGFDAARDIGRGEVVVHAGNTRALMPLHPHNAALQILLELGLVGAGLALVVVGRVIALVERLNAPARLFGQAAAAATLVVSLTAYGVWQNQWLALILSAAALVRLSGQPAAPADRGA